MRTIAFVSCVAICLGFMPLCQVAHAQYGFSHELTATCPFMEHAIFNSESGVHPAGRDGQVRLWILKWEKQNSFIAAVDWAKLKNGNEFLITGGSRCSHSGLESVAASDQLKMKLTIECASSNYWGWCTVQAACLFNEVAPMNCSGPDIPIEVRRLSQAEEQQLLSP